MRKQSNLFAKLSLAAVFVTMVIVLQAASAFGQFDLPDLFTSQQKAQKNKAQIKQFLESKPEQYEQAKKMMSAAVEIVIGEKPPLVVTAKPTAEQILGLAAKSAHSEEKQMYFIYALAVNETPKYKGKFDTGLKLTDATNWVKDYITSPIDNFPWRKNIMDTAFMQVYGREPTFGESADYNQRIIDQKAWFTKIVFDENGKLNKNSAEQKAAVNRAYQKSMGRDASADEIKYWQTRKGNYSTVLNAARSYLYTESGAKDLQETIARAYQAAGKNPPTGANLTKAIKSYEQNKMIYAEILSNAKF